MQNKKPGFSLKTLKLNFFPLILITYCVVVLLISIFVIGGGINFLSGSNKSDGGSETPVTPIGDTVVLTAQQFADNLDYTINQDAQLTKRDYLSLKEGDTLIFGDRISEISYLQALTNYNTIVTFDVNPFTVKGVETSQVGFQFAGDLTDTYSAGDTVLITLTVKHWSHTDESGMEYDMEVFEEGWNEASYIANEFSQVLPESTIRKPSG